MKRIPSVKSVMTAFPFSVDVDAPLQEATEFMRQHRIHHLPVTKNGDLVGSISDRDIQLILGPDFAYPNPDELTIAEVMISNPYTVDLGERLDTVLAYMATKHIDAAIVTRRGKLVGVFNTSDACRSFANFLRDQFRRSGGGTAA